MGENSISVSVSGLNTMVIFQRGLENRYVLVEKTLLRLKKKPQLMTVYNQTHSSAFVVSDVTTG